MIFQFEIVGYPKGHQDQWDGPRVRLLTVEAPDLFEAYRVAKQHGKWECDGKCTIELRNSAKRK